jgi:hypothetical protein
VTLGAGSSYRVGELSFRLGSSQVGEPDVTKGGRITNIV